MLSGWTLLLVECLWRWWIGWGWSGASSLHDVACLPPPANATGPLIAFVISCVNHHMFLILYLFVALVMLVDWLGAVA
jgi:hypothetical protein